MVSLIITFRKRSCGKVMFLHLFVSHSIHGGGGGVSQHAVGQTPPPVHAGIHNPPVQCMLGYMPPPPAATAVERHASYWNAFLLNAKFKSMHSSRMRTARSIQCRGEGAGGNY